ncbi:hypothetical protein ACQR36_23220 [Rhodococcus erythropolis]|uniref:hypothetical protein n=1 Tax=Rhodococcus erythropolis TaxID=1833 RepID=UPI00366D6CC6
MAARGARLTEGRQPWSAEAVAYHPHSSTALGSTAYRRRYLELITHTPGPDGTTITNYTAAEKCLLTTAARRRIGVVTVAGIGLVGYTVLVFPAMAIMGGSLSLAAIGFFAIMVNTAFLQVAVFTIAPQLFDAEHRYTGVAVSYNIGVMVAGGSAPFIAVLLIEKTGNVLSPAFFVVGVALIGLCTLWSLRHRFHSSSRSTQCDARR